MYVINCVKKGIFNSIKIMIHGLLSQIEKKTLHIEDSCRSRLALISQSVERQKEGKTTTTKNPTGVPPRAGIKFEVVITDYFVIRRKETYAQFFLVYQTLSYMYHIIATVFRFLRTLEIYFLGNKYISLEINLPYLFLHFPLSQGLNNLLPLRALIFLFFFFLFSFFLSHKNHSTHFHSLIPLQFFFFFLTNMYSISSFSPLGKGPYLASKAM